MINSNPKADKFDLTRRLFNLVEEMPKDQQLRLLEQLLDKKVTIHLYKLIVEMTGEQRIILLEQLSESPSADLPVKTLSIEDADASIREYPRKPCLINADYSIQDQKYNSYILDISIGGVFIETDTKLPVGKELLLNLSLPNHPLPFTFSGKIAWNNNKGFGLQFENISVLQSDALASFIAQNE